MLMGFVLVLYTMYSWWAEVIAESQAGDHTPVVQIGLRYGMIMFIISEIMFFAAWFWSFFKHAMYPMAAIDHTWPPPGIETFDPWHLPLINTLILLCSGCAATWAHHALVHDNDRQQMQVGPVARDRARRVASPSSRSTNTATRTSASPATSTARTSSWRRASTAST